MSESRTDRIASLNRAADQAVARRDLANAKRLMEEALALEPGNQGLQLKLAALLRASGDWQGAIAVIEAILAVSPRTFHALLMKGFLLERQGDTRKAAAAYAAAISQAPPVEQLDPHTRQALEQGRRLHQAQVGQLRAALDARLRDAAADASVREKANLNVFVDATLGQRRIYRQEPTHYRYPGLPDIEFYAREEFPWLEDLEAATSGIQAELAGVMTSDEDFAPYIDYPDGVPLDQWAALNRSRQWSAYHFHHFGRRFEEHCRRCPRTVSALSLLEQPEATGSMPAAMFSVLKPRTRIPPHTGVANVRLVVHLPLLVPPGCRFRVGSQVRQWRVGEAWVFDDTIEHEAWNDGDDTRVILIADVWSPRLSPTERRAIAALLSTMAEFGRAPTTGDL